MLFLIVFSTSISVVSDHSVVLLFCILHLISSISPIQKLKILFNFLHFPCKKIIMFVVIILITVEPRLSGLLSLVPIFS